MLRNSPLALALLFAIAKARAVWVPINVQSRGENLGYIFNHSAPKLIIAEAALMATIQASGANLASVQVFTTDMVEALATGHGEPSWNEAAPAADETFAVMYTSGTTGPPEGRPRLAPDAAIVGRGGRARVGRAPATSCSCGSRSITSAARR